MIIINASIVIVKFPEISVGGELSYTHKAKMRGWKREKNFELGFLVGVFLEIRDHRHDFLLAQVKTQKKG